MAKTAVERQRERRKRLRENLEEYEAYKANDRQRKLGKPRKSQQNRSKCEIKFSREKERVQKQRYRRKIKERIQKDQGNICLLESTSHAAYSTPQGKGKALRRALIALPSSPRKAKLIVKELAQKVGVESPHKKSLSIKDPITAQIEDKVVNFYIRDDISRQAPGKKDVKTVRVDGVKTKHQKRHLYMTIAEAYQIFKKENQDIKIGKSKFFALRPKFVLPLNQMPHYSCLCKYHENIHLLLTALAAHSEDFPTTSSDLICSIVCDTENEDCMTGMCKICSSKILQDRFKNLLENSTELTWFAWEPCVGRISKIEKEGTVAEAFTELISKLPKFLTHSFLFKIQSQHFREKKTEVDGQNIVLQIDFAENYSITHQDEIQSAHWSHQQVTIFTAVAWIKTKIIQSYVIVSDELAHDKYAVDTFLVTLLKEIKKTYPEVETVNIFSDGAASHFKQRYTLCNMTLTQNELGVHLVWNFFATSHGKGSVDGIGGEIKRKVWQAVLGGKHLVKDAQSFFHCAKSIQHSTTVIFCAQETVASNRANFDEKLSGVQVLPETHMIHFVKAVSPYTVTYAVHSKSKISKNFNFLSNIKNSDNFEKLEEKTVHPGTFVVVQFAGKKQMKQFVGQVSSVEADEYEVCFLKKSTSDKFVFKSEDCAWVPKKDVTRILPTPEIDSRHRYFFQGDVDLTEVE